MKTDQQLRAEFAAMSPEQQRQILSYQGIPLGSAMDLHAQLQALKASTEALKADLPDSIKETMGEVIALLGDIRGDLKDHERRIGCREKDAKDFDARLKEVTGRVATISQKMGLAV